MYYNIATDTTVSFVREDMASQLRYANPGDIVIACTGENREDIAKPVVWEGIGKAAVHDDCTMFHPSMQVNSRYVAYALQCSRFLTYKVNAVNESKVVRMSAKALAAYEVPLPPLAEQERIVAILDRFDALTTSLTDGLPAEIEARRKQYAHYRDRLLAFPERPAA